MKYDDREINLKNVSWGHQSRVNETLKHFVDREDAFVDLKANCGESTCFNQVDEIKHKYGVFTHGLKFLLLCFRVHD